VYLIGYDHIPIHDTLAFARNYWADAGTEITVSQQLTASLAGALDSVQSFEERIMYDPNLLTLKQVNSGALTAGTDWHITHYISSGGERIVAGSTGAGLHGSGELLRLTFYADSADRLWDSSALRMDSIRFGNGFEPVIDTMPGLLRIKNECTPTFVSGRAPASSIEQNTPNPFFSRTRLTYYVGEDAGPTPAHLEGGRNEILQPPAGGPLDGTRATIVRISLYNAVGQEVRRLVDDAVAPGAHSMDIDASSLPASGIYSYSFDCANRHEVHRMVLAK
jgi:hypothetical protein